MKKLYGIVFASVIFLLIASSSIAQVDRFQEMTIVVPTQSLTKVIKPMLPYKIDLNENFSGSFFVQSIENLRINNDKILFSSLISGRDIKYATKIGNQVIYIGVGDVNLTSLWDVTFKYDKDKKTLFVKLYLKESKNEKEFSRGDVLLNAFLKALSGVEYPIDLNNPDPMKSEIHNQLWMLHMDIVDVYTRKDSLFIELIPAVQIVE
jgi:hypothetical protein